MSTQNGPEHGVARPIEPTGSDVCSLGIDIGGSMIKTSLLRGSAVLAEHSSRPYASPAGKKLEATLKSALPKDIGDLSPLRVGLCAPGVYDEGTGKVIESFNVPGLVGLHLREIIAGNLGRDVHPLVISDVMACAHDLWTMERLDGRLLVISLGTGIGACVMDDGNSLLVAAPGCGRSSGHLGQVDVSGLDDEDVPIAPDGGRGGLEAYVGLPALMTRYGGDPTSITSRMNIDDPPLRALVKAIRIAHAIYRPDHVRLAGGIGIRLARFVDPLRQRIANQLTRLARPGWTLACGGTDYHAARGAARLASAAASQSAR